MIKKLLVIYEKRRPTLKKIFIGLIIFFAVFTLVGFFSFPPILKSILTKQLSQNLHREVTIGQIKFNPYTLCITARGLRVKDRTGPETFVSCDEIFLNLQSLSVIRLALILKEIRLTKPYIRVTRNQDQSYNFSDLIEKKESKPPEKEKSKRLRFSVNNIRIQEGSIDFSDEPEKIHHTVRELNIGLPFLSNISSYIQIFVQPHFSAKINGTPYKIEGKTK
ncbi:MAG: AsmA family protein, partial [Thermodesulfobacteriota bacterium]